jgi:hypothetical protein
MFIKIGIIAMLNKLVYTIIKRVLSNSEMPGLNSTALPFQVKKCRSPSTYKSVNCI